MNRRQPKTEEIADRGRATKRPRVLVLGAGDRPSVAAGAERLRDVIERHAEIVVWDLASAEDLSGIDADFVIVLGGDGSILRAAHQMGYHQVPVMGVNLGKLGFLADLSPDDLEEALTEVCAGGHEVVDHLMFECTVVRDGRAIETRLGLNEVVIQSGFPFKILDIDLYVDSELVTTYSCDGLIASTPVGSTAHSLSAGGPIVRQDLPAFVIVPISAHTLTFRPVVDSANRTYEMVIPRPNEGTTAIVDGEVVCKLQAGDVVRVVRAEPSFQLVVVSGRSYYRTLREKLGWAGRLEQRSPSEDRD